MKKLCTLFLVFVAIAAYAQNDEENYIKFDENGSITEFRQTMKDGTFFKLWAYPGSASTLNISLPDGTLAKGKTETNAKELYNSIKNGTVDVVKEIENLQGFNAVNDDVKSAYFHFDEKLIPIFGLSDEDAHKTNLSGLIWKIETQNNIYYSTKGGRRIEAVLIGKRGGLLNDTYGDNSELYVYPKQGFRYGQNINIEENWEGVLAAYKYVSDGAIGVLCVKDKITVVVGNDKWVYFGTIKGDTRKIGDRRTPEGYYYEVYCMDKGLIDTITSVDYLPFDNGKLYRDGKTTEYKKGMLYSITDEKGLITIYDKDGNVDEFETERTRQMAEAKKKKDEENKKLEAQKMAEEKKQRERLNKKYGAKWVQAVEDGELLVGMPFDLFAAGVKNQYFTKPNVITSAEIDHESNGRQCWKVYGYKGSDSAFNLLLTNPKLIGWVYITNGKVSSISWK